ncbi:FadR family transcriptional regulator [Rhodococcus spelaei]|uniref:FadR family transcriptional regulator n=1 Tax=Rhodococcus spelaei TaxID=2546320 RepID=A0A541B188_9NOCA|nr:GntR family transcriptional regulator [Rhodococcus spelaei]TQF66097.1 FadR family transcriptional regulator [Rhodococcus spelaei]
MQPVRRTSLIAQVTDQLRAEIAAGRWPVGERIPTEPELAELTGTGRNTVREAVQALVHAGMLERRQGSGTYVIATSDLCGTLAKYFASAHARDVLELRQTLDVTAAALAARRRDSADIENLRRLLETRNLLWRNADDATENDTAAAVAADVALHRAIVAASHNEVYLEFYDSLLPAITATITEQPVDPPHSYEAEHAELVQAVVDGDGERAATVARLFLTELIEKRAEG